MKKELPAWLTILAAGALIAFGIIQNQPGQVLAKAIRVCMECVGIG